MKGETIWIGYSEQKSFTSGYRQHSSLRESTVVHSDDCIGAVGFLVTQCFAGKRLTGFNLTDDERGDRLISAIPL